MVWLQVTDFKVQAVPNKHEPIYCCLYFISIIISNLLIQYTFMVSVDNCKEPKCYDINAQLSRSKD